MQRTVQFLHHGIAVATVFYEFVTTQFDGVVLADLCLHAGITYTRIGGDKVVALGLVLQILLDVSCHTYLRFQFQHLVVGLSCIRHIGTGSRTDIHNEVCTLEGLQLAFHATQFLTDDYQTLVDELGRVYCHLVLVTDSGLVINRDEHIQHILGTGGRTVLQRHGKDRCLVSLLTYTQIGKVIGCHMGQWQTCNSYLLAYPFIIAIGRWREHHTMSVHCYRIIHAYSLRFGSLTSHIV